MVEGWCGVKKLFAVAVPVWRVCARIAPAGVRLGGQKGVFSGRGGGGCEKSFRGAPGGYRTDF